MLEVSFREAFRFFFHKLTIPNAVTKNSEKYKTDKIS